MSLLIKKRTNEHKRWLAGYTFIVLSVTLVLLYAGGFTTTIGAGMVFEDWPLSNGSLNPPGWTTDQAMMAEHGHRLLGSLVGSLCIGLVFFMWKFEERVWLRRMSYLALGFVVFQGLLGGMRVLLVNVDLAKVHGVTAQIFLCILTAVAVGSSAWWKHIKPAMSKDAESKQAHLRWTGTILCILTICQLVIGAIMRHRGAGLAIPYFPFSSPDGSFLPVAWNWATQLNFAHRAMALVLYVGVVYFLYGVLRDAGNRSVRGFALTTFALINIQVALGAGIIWTARAPIETTLHVLNGALFLSTLWATTFSFFKSRLESVPPQKNERREAIGKKEYTGA